MRKDFQPIENNPQKFNQQISTDPDSLFLTKANYHEVSGETHFNKGNYDQPYIVEWQMPEDEDGYNKE